MDHRFAALIQAFRDSADFIESPDTASQIHEPGEESAPEHWPRRISLFALLWTARQLRAIALLLDAKAAMEAEPIIRSMLEHALTVAWVGSDSERALQYRDDGLSSFRTWMDAMRKGSPDLFPQSVLDGVTEELATSTGRSMPKLQERVKQAQPRAYPAGYLQKVYDQSYRRLSASVHADVRLHGLIVNEPKAMLTLNGQEAAVAAGIMLSCAGECLGIDHVSIPVARNLYALAKSARSKVG